jgi:ATP-dependent HslUV protease ATP-binding subunit HslU
MKTEGVEISFSDEGISKIAELAFQVNEQTENIGARRLHTMMERLLEELSFSASDQSGVNLLIDTDYVNAHLAHLSEDEDLSHYIL